MDKPVSSVYQKGDAPRSLPQPRDLTPVQLRINAAAERRSLIDQFRTPSLHPSSYPAILGGGFRVDAYRPYPNMPPLVRARPQARYSPTRQETTTIGTVRSFSKSPVGDKLPSPPSISPQMSSKIKKVKPKQNIRVVPKIERSPVLKSTDILAHTDAEKPRLKKKQRKIIRAIKPTDLVTSTCTGTSPTTVTQSKITSKIPSSESKPGAHLSSGPESSATKKHRFISHALLSPSPKDPGKTFRLPTFDALTFKGTQVRKHKPLAYPTNPYYQRHANCFKREESPHKEGMSAKRKSHIPSCPRRAIQYSDRSSISQRSSKSRNQSETSTSKRVLYAGRSSSGRVVSSKKELEESSSSFSLSSLTSHSTSSGSISNDALKNSSSENTSTSALSHLTKHSGKRYKENEYNISYDEMIKRHKELALKRKRSEPQPHRGTSREKASLFGSRMSIASDSSAKRRPCIRSRSVSVTDITNKPEFLKIPSELKNLLVHFSADERTKKARTKSNKEGPPQRPVASATPSVPARPTSPKGVHNQTKGNPGSAPSSNAHSASQFNTNQPQNANSNLQNMSVDSSTRGIPPEDASRPGSQTSVSSDNSMTELVSRLTGLSSQARSTFESHDEHRDSNIGYTTEITDSMKSTKGHAIISLKRRIEEENRKIAIEQALDSVPPSEHPKLLATLQGENVDPNLLTNQNPCQGPVGMDPNPPRHPVQSILSEIVPPQSGPKPHGHVSFPRGMSFQTAPKLPNHQACRVPSKEKKVSTIGYYDASCSTQATAYPSYQSVYNGMDSPETTNRMKYNKGTCHIPSPTTNVWPQFGNSCNTMTQQISSRMPPGMLTKLMPGMFPGMPPGMMPGMPGMPAMMPGSASSLSQGMGSGMTSSMSSGMPSSPMPSGMSPTMSPGVSSQMSSGIFSGMPSGMMSGIPNTMNTGIPSAMPNMYPNMFPPFYPGMYPSVFMYPGMPPITFPNMPGMWRPGRSQSIGTGSASSQPYMSSGGFMFPYFPYGMPMTGFPPFPWNMPMAASSHPNFTQCTAPNVSNECPCDSSRTTLVEKQSRQQSQSVPGMSCHMPTSTSTCGGMSTHTPICDVGTSWDIPTTPPVPSPRACCGKPTTERGKRSRRPTTSASNSDVVSVHSNCPFPVSTLHDHHVQHYSPRNCSSSGKGNTRKPKTKIPR